MNNQSPIPHVCNSTQNNQPDMSGMAPTALVGTDKVSLSEDGDGLGNSLVGSLDGVGGNSGSFHSIQVMLGLPGEFIMTSVHTQRPSPYSDIVPSPSQSLENNLSSMPPTYSMAPVPHHGNHPQTEPVTNNNNSSNNNNMGTSTMMHNLPNIQESQISPQSSQQSHQPPSLPPPPLLSPSHSLYYSSPPLAQLSPGQGASNNSPTPLVAPTSINNSKSTPPTNDSTGVVVGGKRKYEECSFSKNFPSEATPIVTSNNSANVVSSSSSSSGALAGESIKE